MKTKQETTEKTDVLKLTDWFKENQPNEELKWSGQDECQVYFIMHTIQAILANSAAEYSSLQNAISVLSTHSSKGVKLPVYDFTWKDIRFILRNNFYDWKVSVILPDDVDWTQKEWKNLFRKDERIFYGYCQGFPEDIVFGSFLDNPKKFTIELSGDADLFDFFKIVASPC